MLQIRPVVTLSGFVCDVTFMWRHTSSRYFAAAAAHVVVQRYRVSSKNVEDLLDFL